MSFNFVGTGGLMVRCGALAYNVLETQTWQNSLVTLVNTDAEPNFDGEPDLYAPISAALQNYLAGAETPSTDAGQCALETINRAIFRYQPGPGQDLNTINILYAMQTVIALMIAQSQTVQSCTVSGTIAAYGSNKGNGVCVGSVLRGDGLIQQNAFAEVIVINCTADSQTGGTASGNETFTFAGQQVQEDVWAFNWPLGSGASGTISAVDGSQSNATGNLLTNSGFDTFTNTNVPDNWNVLTGTAGSDFQKSSTAYDSVGVAIEFLGGTSVHTSLAQKFNTANNTAVNAGGTPSVLLPDTLYALNFWAKCDVVPATGKINWELDTLTPTAINDDQGNANTFQIDLNGLPITTSYAAYSYVFRTPKQLPTGGYQLRMWAQTVIPTGSNFFCDRLALAAMPDPSQDQPTSAGGGQVLYAGGPAVAIFSGSVPFAAGSVPGTVPDYFTDTVANNRGSASHGATFQTFFDRVCGMRELGLLMPYASSPTITDGTYITS
jgi:hypothetical protein